MDHREQLRSLEIRDRAGSRADATRPDAGVPVPMRNAARPVGFGTAGGLTCVGHCYVAKAHQPILLLIPQR